MTVFADSSAVVKVYVDETASSQVRILESMYIADITRVEVTAALWRKSRNGDFDDQTCRRLLEWFDDDIELASGRLAPIEITRDMLRHAALLAGTHQLRAYDAVQLSVALRVADFDATCRTFASYDRQLNEAAAREGFEILSS